MVGAQITNRSQLFAGDTLTKIAKTQSSLLSAGDEQRQGSATSAPNGDETTWFGEGHHSYYAAEEEPPEEEGRARATNDAEHGDHPASLG